MAESVPSVLESEATGEIADVYADIRKVLRTSVVNLIWRNLATMPGALEWTWSTVRPLYLGDAPLHAEAVRQTIALPDCAGFSTDTLAAAGVDETERALIRDVLDSYQHTNALALVVLSALLAHYEPRPADTVTAAAAAAKPSGAKIPELPPMDALDPEVAALVSELNSFGEDTEPRLIASMYRHLAYWPAYLALVRTMLAPLQREGRLNALTLSNSRAWVRAWRCSRGATETCQAAGYAEGCARFLPTVRRTSDCAHDGALRLDPARDPAVTHQPSEHFRSDLSQNDLIALKGTDRRSRFPMNRSKTSNRSSFMLNCSKSFCRMMVISSGYFDLRPIDSFTPSA